MSGNSTVTRAPPDRAFIDGVQPVERRADAEKLLHLFASTTGYEPRMWSPSMVGFGKYHYRYESGREGEYFATGFSPRKAELSIYIMPGYADYGEILARLGKHRTGKSCLYVKRLGDIDLEVLAELIRAGLDDLKKKWPVSAG